MSKRTEPLIRHQSAFISQHKGDGGVEGAQERGTACVNGAGGVGVS